MQFVYATLIIGAVFGIAYFMDWIIELLESWPFEE